MKLLTEALEIMRDAGEITWDRLSDLHYELGSVHARLRDFEAAEQDLREALERREKEHGKNHPLVATTLWQLGEVELELGRLPAAKGHLRRAQRITCALQGPLHPETVAITLELCDRLAQAGAPQEARSLLEHELDLAIEVAGPDDPVVAAYSERLDALGVGGDS
ncbi:MAG TPA: tetratricopeptide repeat protein [Chloroflexaceae bacterium]|nr:tetratricopeptide repeat protein [Chloroflexaceae bacterium]